MKIFYVHHALRAKGNPPSQDDGLKELGVQDAKIVAQIFEDYKQYLNIKAIYTSPYFRCKKTAEIINEKLNVPVVEEPRFNEFVGVFSLVKGEKEVEVVETWGDCQKRIQEAIKEIVNKHEENKNDAVICVTSGVNITGFINLVYGLNASNDKPFPMVPSCSPIGFDITKEMCK